MKTLKERQVNKELKLVVKSLDIDKYISMCKSNNKVDAFIKDYAKYNRIDYQESQLPYVVKMPKSLITSEMLYKLLINSTDIPKDRESTYYWLLDDKHKVSYFKYILLFDDFKYRDLSTASYHASINEEIFEEAEKLNKVFDLFIIYKLNNYTRYLFIKYIEKKHSRYFEFVESLGVLKYKLNTVEICDFLKMMLNKRICDDTSDYVLKKKAIKYLAKIASPHIDLNKVRITVQSLPTGIDLYTLYVLIFKDFGITNSRFMDVCINTQKLAFNFSFLTLDDFKKFNKEQLKMILEYGRVGDLNNHLLNIDDYKSVIDKDLAKEVIDSILIDINPDTIKYDLRHSHNAGLNKDYLKDILIKQDRVATLIKYLDDNIKDEYIDKLVDCLIKQEDYGYDLEEMGYNYMGYNYSYSDPVILATMYEIKNKQTNDKIVNYILGNGNEADPERIKKYEYYVSNIKYLDDENILKLAPYYVIPTNYFVIDFLRNVKNITNIEILKNLVIKTNDEEIFKYFIMLRTITKYSDNELSEKKPIK